MNLWVEVFDEHLAQAQLERCLQRLFAECARQKADARRRANLGWAPLSSNDESSVMAEVAQLADVPAGQRGEWVWAPPHPKAGTRRTRRLIKR